MFSRAEMIKGYGCAQGNMDSLGRTFAAIGFFEYTFVVSRRATFTRRAIFSTHTFHLQPTTYGARSVLSGSDKSFMKASILALSLV